MHTERMSTSITLTEYPLGGASLTVQSQAMEQPSTTLYHSLPEAVHQLDSANMVSGEVVSLRQTILDHFTQMGGDRPRTFSFAFSLTPEALHMLDADAAGTRKG